MRKFFLLISVLFLAITTKAQEIPSTDFAAPGYAFTGSAAVLDDGLIKETHWGEDRAYIRYDGGMHSFAAASWEVQVTRSCFVNVRVYTAINEWEEHTSNPYGNSGHNFSVEIYNSSEERLDTIAEGVYAPSPWDGYRTYPEGGIALGTLYIPEAGTYTIKLKNMRDYSRCGVDSVIFAYAGGERITLPATLRPADALLSEKARRIEAVAGDTLIFAPRGSEGYASDADYTVAGSQYVKWNFKVEKAGLYKFTASTRSFSGHNYRILVYNEDESVRIDSVQEAENTAYNHSKSDGREWIFSTDTIRLATGNYVLKMQNRQHSKGSVMWVTATYEGGAVCDIPGYLKCEEAVLGASVKLIHDENGYLHYGNYANTADEYAFWKIHTTSAYSGKIILDIPQENASGHEFRVELLSALDGAALSSAYESELAPDASHHTKGLIELDQTFEIPAGDYFIKLINKTPWSTAILRGISIAPEVTISETATDLNDLTNGAAVNVTLTRTFYAGMYNTICLPFAVSAAEMNRVFPGAVVKQLTSSSIEEGDFVLNLNFDDVTEMVAGTPYLIRPAADVANPKFLGVTIDKTLRNTTTTKADFVGNFVAGTITASENNLFLGANNTLYFPTQDIDILGMRAYFIIHDAPAGVIKRARIVENEQVATDIELQMVNGKCPNGKFIKNGQLIIIRDGVQYNVMGARMK